MSQTLREKSAAAKAWRVALSDVLSGFGRLVYISSLRDANSGRYRNYRLTQAFGEGEADEVIRRSHQQTFSEWLCFTLEQQKADLDLYLSGLDVDKRTTVETWVRLAPFRNLIPLDALEPERSLFLSDLEILLGLLCREHGVAAVPGGR